MTTEFKIVSPRALSSTFWPSAMPLAYWWFGAAAAPPKEVGKKINGLHGRLAGTWILLDGESMCHGKCMTGQIVSVLQFCLLVNMGSALPSLALRRFFAQTDQALIFERRGGKSMDRLVRACKARGIPTELALWTDDSMADLPETTAMPGQGGAEESCP